MHAVLRVAAGRHCFEPWEADELRENDLGSEDGGEGGAKGGVEEALCALREAECDARLQPPPHSAHRPDSQIEKSA